ncbi:MAG TPA: AAA family ATPase [Ilumatobacter sp.]|nr:AAA family ATPase [Ilumatobacter sp.]
MESSRHLVGRDGPLDRLHGALDDAVHGRGRVVLVAGEPGIGKTALLGALADHAADRSVRVAWGQCWEESMAPAFWPWTQVLRELDDSAGPVSEVGSLTDRPHAVGDGTVDRFALFDAVRSQLIDASTPQGLLVIVDDVHWADEATLALLSFLSRHVQRTRILIAGAFRDVDATPSLARLMASNEVVTLEGLAAHDAADLASAVAAGRLQPGAVSNVVQRAGGNPLFLRELTLLVAAGPPAASESVPVPGGVRQVLAQRLAHLSSACRAMLDVAAVLGAEVRLDALALAVGGRDDLGDLVAEAVQARILTPGLDELSPLVFGHELFREVISALLSPATKAQLHLTVARSLDTLRSDGVALPLAPIAAHYVAAASLGLRPAATEAVRRSQQAAAEAINQLAFEDAADHLRRALAALPLADHSDPGLRLALLLSLGGALDHAGDAKAARQVLEEAVDVARRLGDSDGLAQAAVGIHRLGSLSGLSHHQNVRLLEEAVSGLADQASPLRARALAALARELHHTWDPTTDDQARTVAADAVTVARSVDDPATLAFCLLGLHDTSWWVGSADGRLPIVAEMLDLARLAGDRELLAQAQLLHATALLELGEPSAMHELERYCRIAEDLGHARGRWGALSRRAVVALLAGQFDEAADLGSAAAQLGEEIGEPDTWGVRDTLLWELARFRGDWADFMTEGHWVPPGHWPPIRAVLLTARGNLTDARSVLAGYSLDHDRRHGVRRHDGWMPVIITEAVTAVGSEAQQAEVYDWLRPLAGHHLVYGGCIGYGGAVDHHLAVLAAALGRHDDAIAHGRAALAMHETLGAVAWADLDRLLLADDGPRPAIPQRPATEPDNVLWREGDAWRVTFRGRSSSVRHVKGMLDLAVLLGRPGREVPALELMGGADVGGAPGPVLDDQARRHYQDRVRDLHTEIDDATGANDWERASRAEIELDALVEQLSQAFGLGGRQRASGGAGERARAAVTHRIRSAVRRIAAVDPALGQHLLNAVKTGSWCCYQPDTDIEWTVGHDARR